MFVRSDRLRKVAVSFVIILMMQPFLILTMAKGVQDVGSSMSGGDVGSLDLEPVDVSEGVHVIGVSPTSISISVDNLDLAVEDVVIGTGPSMIGKRVRVTGPMTDMTYSTDTGLPPVPQRRLLLAVPPGTEPVVQRMDHRDIRVHLERSLVARPEMALSTGVEVPGLVEEDVLDRPYPDAIVKVSEPGSAGGLRLAHLIVSQVTVITPKDIMRVEGLSFDIDFVPLPGPEHDTNPAGRTGLAPLGDVLRSQVINPWHTPPMEAPFHGSGSSRALHAPSSRTETTQTPLYKIVLPSDQGLVQVRGSDLEAAGIDIGNVVPSTVKVLFAGEERLPYDKVLGPRPLREVPIIVSGDGNPSLASSDTVTFYAISPDRWDYSNGMYQENLFTDSYQYWLTWGNENGSRMQEWDVGGSSSGTVLSFNQTLHFEKDHLYANSLNYNDRNEGYSHNRLVWASILATSAPYGSRVATVTQAGSTDWTDYWVEANVKRLNPTGEAYLMFRIQGPRDYYVFEYGGGAYRIVKSSSTYVRQVLASASSAGYPMAQNVEYRIRVQVNGGQIDCYVDGNPVVSYNDASPKAKGMIGFDITWWQRWEFDDVEVRDLSNNLLFSEDFEGYGIGDWGAPVWDRVHVLQNHTSPLIGNWSRMTVRDSGGDKVLRTHTDSLDLVFDLDHVDLTKDAHLNMRLLGSKESGKSRSRVTISVNSDQVADESWDTTSSTPAKASHTFQCTIPASSLLEGQNILRIDLPGTGGDSWQEVLLDWFGVSYFRDPLLNGDQLLFNYEPAVHNDLLQVRTSGPGKVTAVDVTNPVNPKFAINTGRDVDIFHMKMDSFQHSVALSDPIGMIHPVDLEPIVSPVWRGYPDPMPSSDRPLYLIITHEDFLPSANNLSTYRKGRGWDTLIVTVQEIYDIFNGGIEDDAAIRNFLVEMYNRPDIRLYHVALLGDTEFVPTHYSPDIMFSYEVATDMYFQLLDDDNGDGYVDEKDTVPDITVSRLSVKSNDEMNQIMMKIRTYEGQVAKDWQRKVFLSEGFDGSQSNWIGDSFTTINDTYLAPNNIEAIMMFRHLLPGESVGMAKLYNRQNISAGRWIFNYAGHGFKVNTQTFDKEDLMRLTNADAYTIDLNFACDTGWLDDTIQNSLIEDFTLIAQKGGIAGWGASRSSTASDYETIQVDFYRSVFTSNNGDLSTTTTLAKILNDDSWLRTHNELYVLNSDPAIEFIGHQDATVTGAGLVKDTTGWNRLETGSPGTLWVEVHNRGRASTTTDVSVQAILKDASGQVVGNFNMDAGILQPRTYTTLEASIDATNLVPGRYTIETTVNLADTSAEISVLNQELTVPSVIIEPPGGTVIDGTNLYSMGTMDGRNITYMKEDTSVVVHDILNGSTTELAGTFDNPGTPEAFMGRSGEKLLFRYGNDDAAIESLDQGSREAIGTIDLETGPCMTDNLVAYVGWDPMGHRLRVVNWTGDRTVKDILLTQYSVPLIACVGDRIYYTEEEEASFKQRIVSLDVSGFELGPPKVVSSLVPDVLHLVATSDQVSWVDTNGIHHKNMTDGIQVGISLDEDLAANVLGLSISENVVAWIDGTDLDITGTTGIGLYFIGNGTRTGVTLGSTHQTGLSQDGESLVVIDDRMGPGDRTVVHYRVVERREVDLSVSSDQLTLLPGSTQALNISVTNTGNIPMDLSLELGGTLPSNWSTVVKGEDALNDLFPKESVNLTLDVSAPMDCLASEEWTIVMGINASLSELASKVVGVGVEEVLDIGLIMDEETVVLSSGSPFEFPVVIENRGNAERDIDLVANISEPWTVINDASLTIGPSSNRTTNITVIAPVTSTTNTTDLGISVTTTRSGEDITMNLSRAFTVLVMEAKVEDVPTTLPGRTIDVNLTIINPVDISFTATVVAMVPKELQVTTENITVEPLENTTGRMEVTIPQDTPPKGYVIDLTVSSDYGEVYLTSIINVTKVLDIRMEAEDARVDAGNETLVQVTVSNHGTSSEVVKLQVVTHPDGWTVRFIQLVMDLDPGMNSTSKLMIKTPEVSNGTYDIRLSASVEDVEVASSDIKVQVDPVQVAPPPPPPTPPTPPSRKVEDGIDMITIGAIAAAVIAAIIVVLVILLLLRRRGRGDEYIPMAHQVNEPTSPSHPDGGSIPQMDLHDANAGWAQDPAQVQEQTANEGPGHDQTAYEGPGDDLGPQDGELYGQDDVG